MLRVKELIVLKKQLQHTRMVHLKDTPHTPINKCILASLVTQIASIQRLIRRRILLNIVQVLVILSLILNTVQVFQEHFVLAIIANVLLALALLLIIPLTQWLFDKLLLSYALLIVVFLIFTLTQTSL